MNLSKATPLRVLGQRTDDAPTDILRPTRESDARVYIWRCPRTRASEGERVLPRLGSCAVVGLRVDGLTIAAVVAVESPRLAVWRASAAVSVPLEGWGGDIHSVDLAVKKKRGGRFVFKNGDVRGVVDEHPIAGCALEVTFSWAFLMSNSLDAAVAYVSAIGATLGEVLELRTRRVDLAADVAGWQITERDRLGWVKPGRSRVSSYVEFPDEDDSRSVRMHGGQRITGYTIGSGGPILLRNYDKREHLSTCVPEKTEIEEGIWRANGWDGQACVARLEFQLRSPALRSFGICSPEGLEAKLDALWQALVQRWCRLAVPGTATRLGNCDVDERWEVLRAVRFHHESHPALRRHYRGGAALEQAMGMWLSYASHHPEASAELGPVPCVSEDTDGTLARAKLAHALGGLALAGARAAASDLEKRYGSPHAALQWLREKVTGSLARAASVGGGADPPPLRESRRRRERPTVDLRAA